MNILEQLVDDAKKKKNELEAKLFGGGQPAAAPAPPAGFHAPMALPQAPAAPQAGLVPSIKRVAPAFGTGMGLGALRSLTGLAQGASGLVDLATPGTGTSRVSDALERYAKNEDQTAANVAQLAPSPAAANALKFAYKEGQAAGDAAQMLVGTGEANAAGKVASELPVLSHIIKPVAAVVRPATEAITNGVHALDDGNVLQRFAGTAAHTLTPANITSMVANTALDQGAQASKGHAVTPESIAASAGGNLLLNTGLPLAGHAAAEAAQAIKPLVRPAVAAAGNYGRDLGLSLANIKPYRNIPDDVVQAAANVRKVQQGYGGEIHPQDYEAYKALQQHIGGDINDPTAIDKVIQDRQTWMDQGRQRVIQQEKAVAQAQKKNNQGGFIAGPLAGDFSKLKREGKTFTGPDGKQRFEGDDSGAQVDFKRPYSPDARRSGEPLSAILDHPELYRQYPQLQDLRVIDASDPYHSNLSSGHKGGYDAASNTITMENTATPEEYRQTLLHEIQHAIQQQEGFAPGGSPTDLLHPDEVLPKHPELQAANDRLKQINQVELSGAYNDMPQSDRVALMRERQDLEDKIQAGFHQESFNQYNNLAGEAEARNVADRKDMSPEQRQAVPFYDTLDVPKGDLIVKNPQPATAPAADALATLREQWRQSGKHPEIFGNGSKNGWISDENLAKVPNTPEAQAAVAQYRQAKEVYYQAKAGQGTAPAAPSGPTGTGSPAVLPVHDPFGSLPKSVPQKLKDATGKLLTPLNEGGYARVPGGKPEDRMTPIGTALDERLASLKDQAASHQPAPGTPPVVEQPLVTPTTPDPETQDISRFPARLLEDPRADPIHKQLLPQSAHDVLHNKDVLARTGAAIQENEAAALSFAKHHDSTEANATALQLLDKYLNNGNYDQATDLLKAINPRFTRQGQETQILAVWSRLTPTGAVRYASKEREAAGKALGKELPPLPKNAIKNITNLANDIQNAPEGEARDKATLRMMKYIGKQVPQGNLSKITAVWKAGLLSGQKTFQGNLVSNGVFAGLKKVSDVPASAVDTLMSLKTGQVTKTATMRGIAAGAREGTAKGVDTLRTGIDQRDIVGNKYEVHKELNFKNKTIQAVFGKPSNLVFRGLSAADQPFYYAAARNNLYDQAMAKAATQGLKGAEAKAFVKNAVENPDTKMATVAKRAADKAVLGYDTLGSKAIQAAHKAIDKFEGGTPAGKAAANATLDFLAPFVKVPSAFLSRTVDFSLAGVGKEVFHQVAAHKFDQRAMSEAIGQGLTGTGVVALGVALAHQNLLSGDYPKNDPKEANRWKAEGITPNSVKLGNKWISLNYLGPVGLLFNAGKQMADAKGAGPAEKAAKALAGFGQGLLGQSFLQGFSGFSDAIKDPARNLGSFAKSEAASVVPAWLNDIANATDPWQRQADSVPQAIKNRVPGARENNKIKEDVYGNQLPQAAGQANTLNSLKPSDSRTNTSDAIAEVSRLHAVDPNNTDFQVTPPAVGKSIKVDKKDVPLNADQQYQLQEATGQLVQDKWNQLVATPEYQKLDDATKAKALNGVRQAASELAQRDFVQKYGLGSYSKGMSADATQIKNNGDITHFVNEASGNPQTYQEKYDAAKAAFETDSKDWTAVQKSKKQRSLDTLAVQKDYPNDIVDLYSLSKPQVYDIVSNDPNGKAMVQQLLEYGDKLKAAGLSTSNKFRDKYGKESVRPKAPKASGTSSRSARSFSTPFSKLTKTSTAGAKLARSAHLIKHRVA